MVRGTKRVKQEDAAQNNVQPNNEAPPVQKQVRKVTMQTLQTVDASNVPEQHMPVVDSLTKLVNEIYVGMRGFGADADKKLEIEDNSQQMSALFGKLNSSDKACWYL